MPITLSRYESTYTALGVCMSAGVPVVLWGPPGQGKTSAIRDLAAQQERHLEVILASIREPQDFAGLPIVTEQGVRLVPPAWAQRLSEIPDGILFLDEVNTAPPSVQAALLRVCLDRVAGDCELSPGTTIVAAANPPEIAADGWDLAPPLANRFCHLEWELPASAVRDGLAGAWPRFDLPRPTVQEVADATAHERIILGAFLVTREELVTVVPRSAVEQGRGFPTPRSWEMASTLLGWAVAAKLPEEVQAVLLRGCIGEGAFLEYMAFRDSLDLPDPESVLAQPLGFEVPVRADKVHVLAGGVVLAVKRKPTLERWLAGGEVLSRLAQAGHADIAVTAARAWLREEPAEARTPAHRAALAATMIPLVGVMNEAGLLDRKRR